MQLNLQMKSMSVYGMGVEGEGEELDALQSPGKEVESSLYPGYFSCIIFSRIFFQGKVPDLFLYQ